MAQETTMVSPDTQQQLYRYLTRKRGMTPALATSLVKALVTAQRGPRRGPRAPRRN